MTTRKLTVVAAAASLAVVGGLLASSAGASPAPTASPTASPAPAPGPSAGPVTGGPLDDTEHDDDLEIEQDDVELEVEGPTTVQMFDLTYPPGSVSGWHSHAGIVLAVVRSGSVVRESGCRSETFTAGEAFSEVGPHHVSNPGPTPAVLSITRVFPTELGAARIPEDPPRCRRR